MEPNPGMFRVFLEPRGLIKLLQFIFVITAFSTTCDFRGQIHLEAICPYVNTTTTAPTTTTPTSASYVSTTTPISTTETTVSQTTKSTTVKTTLKPDTKFQDTGNEIIRVRKIGDANITASNTHRQNDYRGVVYQNRANESNVVANKSIEELPTAPLLTENKNQIEAEQNTVNDNQVTANENRRKEMPAATNQNIHNAKIAVDQHTENENQATGRQYEVSPSEKETYQGFEDVNMFAKIEEYIPDVKVYSGIIKYPFKLEKMHIRGENCTSGGTTVDVNLSGNYVSAASFYVFMGVICFLHTIVAVVFYTFYSNSYEFLNWVPILDLLVTCLLTVMWFAGSIAWATALISLKKQTSLSVIEHANPSICGEEFDQCTMDRIHWQLLDFSVVFGFLNTVLYGGNIWFVFKETSLFSKPPHPTIQ